MFRPEDLLAPREPVFKEPWHAQALALADSLVRAGAFTATEWAEALGAALKTADAQGLPGSKRETRGAPGISTRESPGREAGERGRRLSG